MQKRSHELMFAVLYLDIFCTNIIVVFTPMSRCIFWPNKHSFGDIELKFCHDLHAANYPPNLKPLA